MKFAIRIVFLFVTSVCFCQQDTIAEPYYRTYTEKLSASIFTLSRSNEFELYNDTKEERISLTPNRKTSLGFAVTHDILSLSFGFAPGFFAANKDNKNSKLISFSTSLFPGQWIHQIELFYQKGMTLKPKTSADVYLPNITSFKVGGKSSYNFNKNFSYRARNYENERQLKNAGSFIPSLLYYYTAVQDVDVLEYDTKTKFFNFAIAPAYYYNWVINDHFLVSGGLSVGLGLTQTVNKNNNVTSLLTTSSVDISLGYNTDKFYAGVISKGTIQKRPNSANVIADDTVRFVSFIVGYRFNAPSPLKKFVKDIKEEMEKNKKRK